MGQIFLKYPLIPYPKFSVLLEPSLMKKTPQSTILTYLPLAIVADIDWKETVIKMTPIAYMVNYFLLLKLA